MNPAPPNPSMLNPTVEAGTVAVGEARRTLTMVLRICPPSAKVSDKGFGDAPKKTAKENPAAQPTPAETPIMGQQLGTTMQLVIKS